MSPKKDPRGGPRPGSGRKPKVPGQTRVRLSITLRPATIARMDAERGEVLSRGEWIEAKIDGNAPHSHEVAPAARPERLGG